jgi:hypothetical protein
MLDVGLQSLRGPLTLLLFKHWTCSLYRRVVPMPLVVTV